MLYYMLYRHCIRYGDRTELVLEIQSSVRLTKQIVVITCYETRVNRTARYLCDMYLLFSSILENIDISVYLMSTFFFHRSPNKELKCIHKLYSYVRSSRPHLRSYVDIWNKAKSSFQCFPKSDHCYVQNLWNKIVRSCR